MLKNHKLARVISESMFYTWKVLLQYKCKFYGKELCLVDPKYTSQTCSNCNHSEDRDINAAKNIMNKAFN